jgi:hypothetical protein
MSFKDRLESLLINLLPYFILPVRFLSVKNCSHAMRLTYHLGLTQVMHLPKY